MKLLRNLTNYRNEKLTEIEVNNEKYRTFMGYNPDFLIGFSFGANMNKNSVNEQLSKAIISAQKYFGHSPTFVQAEIGNMLKKQNQTEFYELGKEFIYKSKQKPNILSNINSEEIMNLAIKEKENLNIGNKGLYIAHPAHIERILQIANKKGLESSIFIPVNSKWNNEDIQKWTNSKYLWMPREIAVRLQHKLTGKI